MENLRAHMLEHLAEVRTPVTTVFREPVTTVFRKTVTTVFRKPVTPVLYKPVMTFLSLGRTQQMPSAQTMDPLGAVHSYLSECID